MTILTPRCAISSLTFCVLTKLMSFALHFGCFSLFGLVGCLCYVMLFLF